MKIMTIIISLILVSCSSVREKNVKPEKINQQQKAYEFIYSIEK